MKVLTMSSSRLQRCFHSAGDSGFKVPSGVSDRKGINVVLDHAADFIEKRLAAGHSANDGKQTPMHKRPVFVRPARDRHVCRGAREVARYFQRARAFREKKSSMSSDVIHRWLNSQDEK